MASDDETLAEVAEERPREALAIVDDRLGEEAVTRDRLITVLVDLAREEGLNLARLVNDHPDVVEDLWGRAIEFDETAVELVDDAIEGRLERSDLFD